MSVSSKENVSRLNAIETENNMLVLLKANADIQIADRNVFQNMADLKIKRNDMDLVVLKEKIKGSRGDEQTAYAKRIELLEQKNRELKIRNEASTQSLNDWDLFKREYNADLDELTGTLKDLAQRVNK
ncbi:MAG: hypothetical protein NTV09_13260 [Bacteroidetes bacterium]|nr:hypothetical protein [Bacteroidota bacterium]